MPNNKNRIRVPWRVGVICVVLVATMAVGLGCKEKPPAGTNTDTGNAVTAVNEAVVGAPPTPENTQTNSIVPTNEPVVEAPVKPANTLVNPTDPARPRLEDVINSAAGWGPIYQPWYGKPAPDFTLTDIAGKEHRLSDYRGKDVMLVMWATWCRPCIMEIPHLIALQNVMGKNKVVILAISYITPMNTEKMIKGFVASNERINYPVFAAEESRMPAPYNMIEGIPSSFFIDPQGRIKLATSGMLSLGYMKAILQAQ
ncbi:MAG TPA: TlpA disulfide reductase family protein [Sedimentisphaerales bacterium]|nr:TlpA disulfide reductase family protein [Sedimentisphaerales bacterium]